MGIGSFPVAEEAWKFDRTLWRSMKNPSFHHRTIAVLFSGLFSKLPFRILLLFASQLIQTFQDWCPSSTLCKIGESEEFSRMNSGIFMATLFLFSVLNTSDSEHISCESITPKNRLVNIPAALWTLRACAVQTVQCTLCTLCTLPLEPESQSVRNVWRRNSVLDESSKPRMIPATRIGFQPGAWGIFDTNEPAGSSGEVGPGWWCTFKFTYCSCSVRSVLYPDRKSTVRTVGVLSGSLFLRNQRIQPEGQDSWPGDWILWSRRKRKGPRWIFVTICARTWLERQEDASTTYLVYIVVDMYQIGNQVMKRFECMVRYAH